MADCFKYRNKVGMDVALEALRESIRHRKCTQAEIWKYAKVCRIATVMRPYLEAVEWGYQELLAILKDPSHEEHKDRIGWLDYMKGLKGKRFDPEHFDLDDVRFEDPYKRWKVAFDHEPMPPENPF